MLSEIFWLFQKYFSITDDTNRKVTDVVFYKLVVHFFVIIDALWLLVNASLPYDEMDVVRVEQLTGLSPLSVVTLLNAFNVDFEKRG